MFSTKQKAFAINSSSKFFGSFCEIGAAQEVVGHFFKAGKASGSVAKSLSAYDMTLSDAYYGKSSKYVSLNRLKSMLQKEQQEIESIFETNKQKLFFIFANTVKTKAYGSWGEASGWMGLSYQRELGGPFYTVHVHFNLLDNNYLMQQEVIGILGVNLIYATFYEFEKEELFLRSIIQGLGRERVNIDYITVTEKFSNTTLNLTLVKEDMTQAILFDEQGNVAFVGDTLYKKEIILTRGSFKPPTLATIDMVNKAKEYHHNALEIFEIGLQVPFNFDEWDLTQRIFLLNKLNKKVLVTKYLRFYELAEYFKRYSLDSLAFVLSSFHFDQIFNPEYLGSKKNILESLGVLFQSFVKVYLYPLSTESNSVVHYKNESIKLYEYLVDHLKIDFLKPSKEEYLSIYPKKVYEMIESNNLLWKNFVPQVLHNELKPGFFSLKKS